MTAGHKLAAVDTPTPMLLGLGGFGGSGKSTGADALVRTHGWEHRAYADKLREFMLAADLYLPDGRLWREVYHEVGYTRAKAEVDGFRALMVSVGDEVRNVLGFDTWVNAALRCLSATTDSVFSDVRYPNEIDGIRDRGGVLIWVDRAGVGPAIDTRTGEPFVSEVAVGPDDFDHTVVNASTPEHLAAILRAIVLLHYGEREPATLAG